MQSLTTPPRAALVEASDTNLSRQPRLLVVAMDGTWAGGVRSSRRTVVSELRSLIDQRENVFVIPINGVGSDDSLLDWLRGGIGGFGTLQNVIKALSGLASNYETGDRVILIGYSRGAWAVRYLTLLINTIGLSKDADERFYRQLYKACDSASLFDRARIEAVARRFDFSFNTDVKIDALCCFDTVGSLGIARTGILKPLALSKLWSKKVPPVVSKVEPNVVHAFHALSLHEQQRVFNPTLMENSPCVRQVFFPGDHGDLGWIEAEAGLVHAPLAWMIQQLNTYLEINFNQAALDKRFRQRVSKSDGSSQSASPTQMVNSVPAWCRRKKQRTKLRMFAIFGIRHRQPGRLQVSEEATSVQIHVAARLRHRLGDGEGYGVPGYRYTEPPMGRPYWKHETQGQPSLRKRVSEESTASHNDIRSRDTSRTDVKMAEGIEEAELGPLEAQLLRISDAELQAKSSRP